MSWLPRFIASRPNTQNANVITAPPPVYFRWMLTRDLPRVAELDGAAFDRPWTAEHLNRQLATRDIIGTIAIDPYNVHQIVGYMVYGLPRPGYPQIWITRAAIAEPWRRRGVGRAFIRRLQRQCTDRPTTRKAIVVDVPDDLLTAHLWLKNAGFTASTLNPAIYRFAWWPTIKAAPNAQQRRPAQTNDFQLFELTPEE